MQNCYNTSSVSNSDYAGGVVGEVRESTVTNCYYLEGTAETGIGVDDSGDGEATALTIAQIEDTGTDGLLAKLSANIPAEEENPWNATLSAVGAWEYGKPAIQPVFTWQNVIQNAPTYSVTIPEKATAEGDAVSVSMTGSALLAAQQVEVSVAEDTAFNLYYGGNTNDDSIAYQVFAGDSQTALTAGQTILTGNNTEAGKPNQVGLTFDVTGTPKYSGDYTGIITFTVSVGIKDAA